MHLQRFSSPQEMAERLAEVLIERLADPVETPVGVMLAGGSTPVPAYQAVAEEAPPAGPAVHVFFSDERMVPFDHHDSNYGRIRPILGAIGLPPVRRLFVPTENHTSAQAAEAYEKKLRTFFDAGGRVTFGLLGLGADGHTASLFSEEEIDRCAGRLAVSVAREEGPDRVSVTPEVLRRCERLVFAVAGSEKTEVVERFLRAPKETPAGYAVQGAGEVELWVA